MITSTAARLNQKPTVYSSVDRGFQRWSQSYSVQPQPLPISAPVRFFNGQSREHFSRGRFGRAGYQPVRRSELNEEEYRET